MSFPSLSAALIAAVTLLSTQVAYAQEAESSQSSAETAQNQPERCQSMPDEAQSQCRCIYERARASGATDDQIALVLNHPIDDYTPPSTIERATFIQVRRAQTTCAVTARYAQPDGEEIGEMDASADNRSNGGNPQPDGSYVGRPVRPTPRIAPSKEVVTETYDGPCAADAAIADISALPRR